MQRTLPFLLLLVLIAGPAFAQSLSGDYYVGEAGTAPGDTDPDYATLGEAFADLNEHGVSGAVTLLITSDLDDSESDFLLKDVGLTAENSLTIRPAEGATPTVRMGVVSETGATGSANLGIVNTGYITIDGSAEVGGDSRDLTLLIVSMSNGRGVVITGDSPDVTIRNTKILIDFPRSGAVGVRISSHGGIVPKNSVLENNQIGAEGASYAHAIALVGIDATQDVVDVDIINNDLWASERVISTYVVGDARYEGNRLNLTGQFNPLSSFWTGMYIVLAENLHIAGNEFVGGITNNAAGHPTTGVVFNSNTGDIFVYNNMFSVPEFTNLGAGQDSEYIAIGLNNAGGAGGNHYIYNNTVRIDSSDQSGLVAAFGASVTIGGLERITKTEQGWELRNNLFVVEHEADNAYAIYWPVDHELDSDNNNLYVPNGNIGHYNGTDQATLPVWRALARADRNSISKEVEFVSETDLRLTGASIGDDDLLAPRIDMVEVDIDGNERGAETTYMGAHEAGVGVSSERVAELPDAFELHQNYPNPFNPSTTISYTLRDPGHVRIQVYNAVGQLVNVLVDSHEGPGVHEVNFDAGNMASGMYIYRMEFDGRAETRQMMLVK